MVTETPSRGDVWLVDLGMVAKVRPCLVISAPATEDSDPLITTIVPHTTSTRDSRFEIVVKCRFLKPGAFDVQNVITIPTVKLIRKLGELASEDMLSIETGLRHWLGL